MLRLDQDSHRRYNALTGEWVIVSPHRTARPWQGAVEKHPATEQPQYDPTCYLCPGNERAGGVKNPKYSGTFVFDNDYAALQPDAPSAAANTGSELLRAEGERGICRVLCFSPRHDLTLATMPMEAIERVVDIWAEQTSELGAIEWVNHVQIFENRGSMMGASNPHPHCQIWGCAHTPNEHAKELQKFGEHASKRHSCLLCDYLRAEIAAQERIVFENEHFLVVVPFWALWPFETLLLPREHVASLPALSREQRRSLAEALSSLTRIYDRVFDAPFPYSMGFHQDPAHGQRPEWHLHAHFYPPLLRSATIRKFMVGFEMLGTAQRDFTPEAAASRLRDIANRM